VLEFDHDHPMFDILTITDADLVVVYIYSQPYLNGAMVMVLRINAPSDGFRFVFRAVRRGSWVLV
jgi:hypothetical protein